MAFIWNDECVKFRLGVEFHIIAILLPGISGFFIIDVRNALEEQKRYNI